MKQTKPKTCQLHGEVCLSKETFRNNPLLESLSEAEYDKIQPGLSCVFLRKGEFAFQSGDPAEYLYIICSGSMKVYLLTPEGKEQILYIYTRGDFVGGHNLLSETEYRYMGEALESTNIIRLHKRAFDEVLIHNPQVLIKILSKSFERIRWAEDLITRLSASNAEIKTAALLLTLVEEIGVAQEDGIHLDLRINREEMGSYAGMTRETITRKLLDFQDRGWIEPYGARGLLIKDKEALRRVIGIDV